MYEYNAKILKVYDGDGVFHANVDMGMNLFQRKEIRLYGYDAPEMRGNHYDAGVIVRDYVRSLILDKDVVIITKKDKSGKYGRLLADIIINGVDLGKHLFEKKYVKIYNGGKKEIWTNENLNDIISENKKDNE